MSSRSLDSHRHDFNALFAHGDVSAIGEHHSGELAYFVGPVEVEVSTHLIKLEVAEQRPPAVLALKAQGLSHSVLRSGARNRMGGPAWNDECPGATFEIAEGQDKARGSVDVDRAVKVARKGRPDRSSFLNESSTVFVNGKQAGSLQHAISVGENTRPLQNFRRDENSGTLEIEIEFDELLGDHAGASTSATAKRQADYDGTATESYGESEIAHREVTGGAEGSGSLGVVVREGGGVGEGEAVEEGESAGAVCGRVGRGAGTVGGASRVNTHPGRMSEGSKKRRPSAMVWPRFNCAISTQRVGSPKCDSAIVQRQSPAITV